MWRVLVIHTVPTRAAARSVRMAVRDRDGKYGWNFSSLLGVRHFLGMAVAKRYKHAACVYDP